MITIFEKSHKDFVKNILNDDDIPNISPEKTIDKDYLRTDTIGLPQVSELDVVRHYTLLSQKNFSVDTNFYPLGSCTMKYNPKINEYLSSMQEFINIHPYQDENTVQGALQILYEMQKILANLTGLTATSLQPAAGAHGELTGIKIFKKYFEDKGETNRKYLIIPDNAHGTNPATASMAGFEIMNIKSNDKGMIDVEGLRKIVNNETAGIMLTNPNTLGIFEKDILEIADIMHKNGSLLYYDGANMNALVGKVRPGDMGFDVVHLNLHKTFSTPHGGGGPGSGPICVSERLKDFLPFPVVVKENDKYSVSYSECKKSIGRVRSFYGNFNVILKAYFYILSLGIGGLSKVSELSVLNATYLKEKLKKTFILPYDLPCMHEFVLSVKDFKDKGIHAVDFAKRLIDFGIHPPTVYFPLIVKEAMMIEPTETESKRTLDYFVSVMEQIYNEALNEPDLLLNAPSKMPVDRLDEANAVRKPKVTL